MFASQTTTKKKKTFACAQAQGAPYSKLGPNKMTKPAFRNTLKPGFGKNRKVTLT